MSEPFDVAIRMGELTDSNLVARLLARLSVAAGRLRRVLPDWQGKSTPVYAITETRLLPAKTQRFIEYLQERLGQRPASQSL